MSHPFFLVRIVALMVVLAAALMIVAADPVSASTAPEAACLSTPQGCPAPTPTQAMGAMNLNTANIVKLSNWLMWLALLACIIGIFVSASLWALGSKGQNPGQELTGKKGLILCCTAAFFVGALPGMLNFLNEKAHEADNTGITGTGRPANCATVVQAANC